MGGGPAFEAVCSAWTLRPTAFSQDRDGNDFELLPEERRI
jgi:hypothetical protein